MVKSPIDLKRIEYTKLLERKKNAEAYLNNPLRTSEEIEKWKPEYKKLLKQLNDLLSEIRYYKPENILEGWPDLLQ